ncbi:MAG: NAD(P)-dependent oxidoreductase [Planctomycetaceae bacterium]
MSDSGSAVVLVTGGAGFIGTWVLRELLARGARPIVVDVNPTDDRWHRILGDRRGDVTRADASLLDCDSLLAAIHEYSVTHMIHLAALLTPACQQDPLLGCRVNVLGSTSLFDAARRSRRVNSIAYASSYAVYGDDTGPGRSSNSSPPMFYGVFKQAVDQIAEQYWRHFGISSVAIRPHVVYGPERDQGLTAGPSLACKAAALGKDYTMGYTGTVGYDFVPDVATAFVRAALECPDGAAIVDLPSQPATTEEFARLIEEVAPESAGHILVDGPAIPSNIPPAPNYIATLFPDWQPTSLRDGIRQTVDFYRSGATHP